MPSVERKLADVGGYSLLVGADKRARQLHS
jgi:hypothetical protein